jgi:hypothetical protein
MIPRFRFNLNHLMVLLTLFEKAKTLLEGTHVRWNISHLFGPSMN